MTTPTDNHLGVRVMAMPEGYGFGHAHEEFRDDLGAGLALYTEKAGITVEPIETGGNCTALLVKGVLKGDVLITDDAEIPTGEYGVVVGFDDVDTYGEDLIFVTEDEVDGYVVAEALVAAMKAEG